MHKTTNYKKFLQFSAETFLFSEVCAAFPYAKRGDILPNRKIQKYLDISHKAKYNKSVIRTIKNGYNYVKGGRPWNA
jgi:hypothetical protein